MFLYSTLLWLYKAATRSRLLVINKVVFELWVCILLHWHVYFNTPEMICLNIMNCGVLSPGQINPTNRITVLTEKLPHENGDVPDCAILQLRARNPEPPDASRLYTIMLFSECYEFCKAPEHVNTQLLYFTMLFYTIWIHIFPTGDSNRTIKILVTSFWRVPSPLCV